MENDKHFILDVRLERNSSSLSSAVSGYVNLDFSLGNYFITLICPASSPKRLILNTDQRTGFYLDGYLLSDADLSLDSSEILTSLLEKHGEINQIMLGIYNLILLDADTRSVQIYNDALGSFPCYYLALPNRLLISNSLWLLKQYTPLEINGQGFSERFALSFTLGNKTIFKNVFRTSPGSCYRIDLTSSARVEHKRLARTWSHSEQPPLNQLLNELSITWQKAVDRCISVSHQPLGLMLSGGLDSRLVLGGADTKSVQMIACTHGYVESTEALIARHICNVMGIKHIFNPMNDDFGFDQLALHEVLKHTDLMFNPIWYSSLLLLSAQGVRYFATGMLGDVLLGGSYYWFPSVHERFRYSLMLSVGMHPDYDSAPHEHSIKRITTNIAQSARRRLNHHRSLLRPDYRQICDDSMRNLESELQLVLFSYVENASNIGGQQIMERFLCEHRDRQYVAGQELLIRAFGESVLPTSDRDFVNLLTNIASVLKHDHYLYYRFFRQTYPHLSKIDVPNLYGSIDAPQLIIELRRAANLTFRKSLKKTRSWVNFHNWMTNSPERLHKYRQEYLNLESIFAPDKVIEYFDAVQRGEQRLYDGNDTLNFLSTALLVS